MGWLREIAYATEKPTGVFRRRHKSFMKHSFTSSRGAERQAALQEKYHFSVAAVRPPGIASAKWSPFAGGGRSSSASTGYGSCIRPGVLLRPGPTGRFDQRYKTMNEFRGEELKGESNANVAEDGIGTQNYSGAGAENTSGRS